MSRSTVNRLNKRTNDLSGKREVQICSSKKTSSEIVAKSEERYYSTLYWSRRSISTDEESSEAKPAYRIAVNSQFTKADTKADVRANNREPTT